MLNAFIYILGLISFLGIIWRLGRLVYIYVIGAIGIRKRLAKYGNYIVITGCTRGMGLEFTKQFAAMQFNLVLIARNSQRLKEIANEMEQTHGIKCLTEVIDLADIRAVRALDLKQRLGNIDIGIFLNNAGVMYNKPMKFQDVEPQFLVDMIDLNVKTATILIQKMLTDYMLPCNKGLIVNFSSGATMSPTPYYTAYAATKAYIDVFTRCLGAELLDYSNVHVLSLIPYYVRTDMVHYSKFLQNDPTVPDATTYCRYAIRSFGMTKRDAGYWIHSLFMWVAESLNDNVAIFCSRKFVHFLMAEEKQHD